LDNPNVRGKLTRGLFGLVTCYGSNDIVDETSCGLDSAIDVAFGLCSFDFSLSLGVLLLAFVRQGSGTCGGTNLTESSTVSFVTRKTCVWDVHYI